MTEPVPRSPAIDPGLGYRFAVLNAVISGFAVFINSAGVKTFSDSTVYTTLKNGVVGVCILIPFLFMGAVRREVRVLDRGQWRLLILIAFVAGSVAYALDFRGLQLSTPATAALIDHMQFLFVAACAALVLHERISRTVLIALLVLAAGLMLGVHLQTVRLDAGVPFLIAGTLLFAVGAVLMKMALETISVATVMAVKMTLGSALLFVYVVLTGRLSVVVHLSALQWGFAVVTGFILLAFTLTEILGLRHASATGVTAISAGAPIITVLLAFASRRVAVDPLQLLGLGAVLAAVLTIYAVGCNEERRASKTARRLAETAHVR